MHVDWCWRTGATRVWRTTTFNVDRLLLVTYNQSGSPVGGTLTEATVICWAHVFFCTIWPLCKHISIYTLTKSLQLLFLPASLHWRLPALLFTDTLTATETLHRTHIFLYNILNVFWFSLFSYFLFLWPCKALWVVLCLNCEIQINLPCLTIIACFSSLELRV